MLFNSSIFFIFFSVVTLLFFLLPLKYRRIMLLVASYYFYLSWDFKYIILLAVSTIVTYGFTIFMDAAETAGKRKFFLVMNLVINLGFLFVFKYFNFMNNTISEVVRAFNMEWGVPNFEALLPIGVSFYIFKSIGYTIDVYRKDIEAEGNIITFALFVSFFPQLLAGPIERAKNYLHQFNEVHTFDYDRVMKGLMLMAWGFFQKIVIADRIAVLVDTVYNNCNEYTGLPLLLAAFLYSIQILCDFAGYSDIAIGAGQVLGFKTMDNFLRPYSAKTIREFWQRWHISLSTWFRDYLYIPMGGSRVSTLRRYYNLFITFVVSGLWHGADWKFVIWGGLHGVFLIISYMISGFKEKVVNATGYYRFGNVRKGVQIALVFTLVTFAWIFFRANTFSDSIYIVSHLFTGIGDQLGDLSMVFRLGLNEFEFIILILSLIIFEAVHFMQRTGSVRDKLEKKSPVIRWALYYSLVMWILFFQMRSSGQFIYFQF
jgi:alginate O-acetyltransferase complex protein AlgI